jgi:hypothetical protein
MRYNEIIIMRCKHSWTCLLSDAFSRPGFMPRVALSYVVLQKSDLPARLTVGQYPNAAIRRP